MSRFWTETASANSIEYADPSVQLFDRQVQTGCGGATSAVGPFYCPPDQRIYIDTTFFQQMRDQFGASGGSLALVCTDQNISKIFEITGLDRVFPIHKSRDEALSSLAPGGATPGGTA